MLLEIYLFLQNAAFTKKMGPRKDTRMRKVELSTNSIPKFELGDTAADKEEESVTVMGKRGSNYRLSLSCNRKKKQKA